ncbi:hypothetical protein HQ533_01595 [Candidatus Woesearchaeota archaeon]|nr:hypothetical protein [Candidatus Woesearchaeota archaeon]
MRNITIDKKFFKEIIEKKKLFYKQIEKEEFDTAISNLNKETKKCQAAVKQNCDTDEILCNQYVIINCFWGLLRNYCKFWRFLGDNEFQASWNLLQDCFGNIRGIDMASNGKELFDSDNFYKHLLNIEKLYPYKMFISTELIVKKIICSICEKSPYDNDCNHIKGELYAGKFCINIVKDAELIGSSFVENPSNKRCVILINYDKSKPRYSSFGKVWQFSKITPLHEYIIKPKKVLLKQKEFLEYAKALNVDKEQVKNQRFVPVTFYEVTKSTSII